MKAKDFREVRRLFPNLPSDYGFRNNAHFWFTRHSPPYREPIPRSKEAGKAGVRTITPEFLDAMRDKREREKGT